jgi:hypothetical protein
LQYQGSIQHWRTSDGGGSCTQWHGGGTGGVSAAAVPATLNSANAANINRFMTHYLHLQRGWIGGDHAPTQSGSVILSRFDSIVLSD